MISQETFDAMVRENMEDFEMCKDDALKETISQLTSMGKDLSAVDTTDGKEREDIIACIATIKNFRDVRMEEFALAVLKLQELCNDKYEFGKRNQNIFRMNGGMGHMITAIDTSLNASALISLLDAIAIICRTNGKNKQYYLW